MNFKSLTRENILEYFPKREKASHKGAYGKNAIFASCDNFVGASKLAALGSLSMRMGSGYTCLALTKTVADSVAPEIFECTLSIQEDRNGQFSFNKEKVDHAIAKADSVAVGMGMGKSEEVRALVEYLFECFEGTLLLDADGLNSVDGELLSKPRRCELILTPHYGEFSRLTGLLIDEISRNRENLAVEYAQKWRCTLLLKSEESVITDGEMGYKTVNSSPSLAKAGSGDFLAGAISALALRLSPIEAAAVASQLIAFIASDLAERYNDNVILARDISVGALEFFKK